MSDRLPAPVEDAAGEAPLFERASATSARAMTWGKPLRALEGGKAPTTASLRALEENMIEAITGSETAAATGACSWYSQGSCRDQRRTSKSAGTS